MLPAEPEMIKNAYFELLNIDTEVGVILYINFILLYNNKTLKLFSFMFNRLASKKSMDQ